MSEISTLSDADLLAALKGPAPAMDLSSMSDADLIAALGEKSEGPAGRATRAQREDYDAPSKLESFARAWERGGSYNFGDEARGLQAAGGASDLQGYLSRLSPGTYFGSLAAGAGRMLAEKAAPSIFGTGGTETYNRTVDQNRADNQVAETENPITTIIGQVAGGAATPVPAAAVATPLRAAATGAGLSALFGIGEGRTAQERAEKGATGAVVGGVLGGAFGKLFGPGTPKQPGSAVAGQDAAAAANRQGVDLPRAIATESTAQQRIGQGLRNIPLVGDAIPEAMRRTNQQVGQKVDDIVTGLGSGERFIAGQRASEGIQDWMTGKSAAVVSKAYEALDSALDPAIRTPLNNTQDAIARIVAKRQQGGASVASSKAVDSVVESVMTPGGLNFEGMKQLRSDVGTRMSKNLNGDFNEGELKLLYGGLTKDMEAAAQTAGGTRGLSLFKRANTLNEMVASRREQLAKIVGSDGSASSEQVFERLASYATSGKGGDLSKLALARNVLGGDEWNEVASAVIGRIGRDANGDITPDRLVTAYGKLSDTGKNLLFGANTAHRKAIDDFFQISVRMQDVGRKFGNPSGTAQNVAGGSLAGAAFTAAGAAVGGNFIPAASLIGGIVGGKAMAGYLANPASASSMAKWAKAYEYAVRYPTVASATALDRATKNFATTVGESAGVPELGAQIMKQLSGPRMAPAEESEKQP
jgi:hypothetical protein